MYIKNTKKQDFMRLPNSNKILLSKITCTSYLYIFYNTFKIKASQSWWYYA